MFNVKLYKDTLRQLRIMGMIFAIISIFVSCISPVLRYFQYKPELSGTNDYAVYPTVPGVTDIAPVLFFMVFIAGLVLTMIAFSFLNKRNSSDFYHSLPNTRICTYVSIVAAVVTWIAIIIIATVLMASGFYFALGMTFNPSFIWYTIASFMASTCLVAAVVTLSMSITGTMLSNLIVAGIIGFLPRFIFVAMTEPILNTVSVATSASLGILDITYNLPVSFLITEFMFTGKSLGSLLTFGGGIAYTAAAALAYFALAGFMFHIRKSEAADKNAPNKVLQHVYRCLITLPFLLPIVMSIIMNGVSSSTSMIAIFGITSILVYFIYEIITTRKVRNLIKVAPMYLVVVFAVVAIGGVTNLVKSSLWNNTPTADQIEYVQLGGDTPQNSTKSFFDSQLEEVKYKEEEIKQIFAEELKKSVEADAEDIGRYGRGEYYGIEYVQIKLNNGSKISRKIHLSESNYQKLLEVQKKSVAFMEQARKFPSHDQVTNVNNLYGLDRKETDDLLDVYRAEIVEMSDADYFAMTVSGAQRHTLTDFYISSRSGVDFYDDSLSLGSLTPKTVAYYTSTLARKKADATFKQIEFIKNFDANSIATYEWFNVSVQGSNSFDRISMNYYGGDKEPQMEPQSATPEDVIEILTILQSIPLSSIDAAKPYVCFEASANGGGHIITYFQVTDEQLAAINDIAGINPQELQK